MKKAAAITIIALGLGALSVALVGKKILSSVDASLPETYTNSIGMEFVLIPAGSFDMGCAGKYEECQDGELSQRRVTIDKPFYMSKYEVTQKEWTAVMGASGIEKVVDVLVAVGSVLEHLRGKDNNQQEKHNQTIEETANYPQWRGVDWPSAQGFIRNLNAKEGTNYYRLPNGSEWEYAARAGTPGDWPWFCGKDASCLKDVAWQSQASGYPRPHAVGQKSPNPWGLYDMYGNVREWTDNCGKDDLSVAQGTSCPFIEPRLYLNFFGYKTYVGGVTPDNQPPSCADTRGGDVECATPECFRSAARYCWGKFFSGHTVGVRLVLDAAHVKEQMSRPREVSKDKRRS